MDDAKVDTDFFSILKDREPILATCFENVQKKGLEDWVHLLTPDLGSHTGYPHLRDVERIANRIIPDELKASFSAGEIFLLLNAIFLHDIGKTISPPKRPIAKCVDPDNCGKLDDKGHPVCYMHKWSHFALGEEFIKNNGIALGLPDERIAKYCGLITFCHGLPKPPTEDQPLVNCNGIWPKRGDYRTTSLALYGVIRIPLLAAILRIADETDDSWTRGLRDYWYKDYESNSVNLGKGFRRCIEDIEFSFDGQCLVMHIPEMDELEIARSPNMQKYIDSINKARNEIYAVIKEWGPELEKIGVKFIEVYIEYKNHLFIKIDPKSGPSSRSLVSDMESPDNSENNKKNKKSVKEMFDALIDLSLGSYGYPQFTWETLEAQVGHPLTGVDKWLAKRIADASNNHIVINEQNEIWIKVDRGNVAEVTKLIYE